MQYRPHTNHRTRTVQIPRKQAADGPTLLQHCNRVDTKAHRCNKLIVIVGPTASGKTALAIRLAKKYDGEIISADSRQVYREMNIGTAKAPRDTINNLHVTTDKKPKQSNVKGQMSDVYFSHGVVHHLVDIRNPNQDYTVADFKKDAVAAIQGVLTRGKLPILVGGTGLYVDAVVKNLDIPPVKKNAKLRRQLENALKERGLAVLFKKLLKLDPEAAYVVDPKNPRRVIRALEVALTTGKPFTAQRKVGEPLFDCLLIGIKQPPDVLKKRIEQRTRAMIRAGLARLNFAGQNLGGLVAEVKRLVKKYGKKQKAFDAIGYREIIEHLEGKTTLREAIEAINKNTRHFAKRQMTWFKRNKEIGWIQKPKEAKILTRKFLEDSAQHLS